MNSNQLLAIAPSVGAARAGLFLPALNAAMARFEIRTVAEQAHFVAQQLVESANFTRMVENLNYSPQGLLGTFGRHFTPAQAEQFGRTAAHPADQRMIASIAYANRLGNGDVHSEEGWRYRGRGPIQITGKVNYLRCGNALGIDLLSSPEMLEQPEAGCLAAAWYWHIGNPLGHSLNGLANAREVDAISRAINGGNNALAERAATTRTALGVLA